MMTIRHCFGCKYSKDNHNQDIEECHLCMWKNQYTPTTKNDLPHCQYTDEEIAKSFIEDVEAVKDQLPCGEQMDFPNTFDEFAKDYGFRDKKEIYTNGSELIPVFRVKQWLEHISTTKNDLGVDCILRADARHLIAETFRKNLLGMTFNKMFETLYKGIDDLSSVTPQAPKKGHWLGYREYYENLGVVPNGLSVYKWCSNCDCGIDVREWHRIHYNYCPNCGADMREVEE